MEKYGFVYIWRDRKRKMYYIGSHWGTEQDKYICSSDRMRHAYRRRPKDFKRRILSRVYTNRKELFDEEQKWFDLVKKREIYYNLSFTVKHTWAAMSDEDKLLVKQKFGAHIRGKTHAERYGEEKAAQMSAKIRAARAKQVITDEHKAAIAASMLGQTRPHKRGVPISDEHRAKLCGKTPWNKGKPQSEEQRNAHSERMKGRVVWNKGLKTGPSTPERIAKFKEAVSGEKHFRYGKTLSEEHRRKISEANKRYFENPENRLKTSEATKLGMVKKFE